MSKTLSMLIAGLFAASAFAADAPKPATPDVKPAVEAAAPAKAEAKVAAPAMEKKVHKTHKKHKAAKAAKTETAAPAGK